MKSNLFMIAWLFFFRAWKKTTLSFIKEKTNKKGQVLTLDILDRTANYNQKGQALTLDILAIYVTRYVKKKMSKSQDLTSTACPIFRSV